MQSPPGFAGLSARVWSAIAAAVLCLATLYLFRVALGHDLSAEVPLNLEEEAREGPSVSNWKYLAETDIRFLVWLASRNAYTLVHHPLGLFDAEQCHPASSALAFGESGIAFGVAALPTLLFGGDPVVTFNLVLVGMTLLGGAAMFLLVREWTACPPAGIAAALLYVSHVFKTGDLAHVIIWDTTWIVFAFYFATRVFSGGRWRDAIGLALSVALQMAGSLYPLLAGTLLAIPFIVWLVMHFGVRRLDVPKVLVVVGIVAVVATLALGPYLTKSSSGQLDESPYVAFSSLYYVLPGGGGFAGWVAVLLIIAGLVRSREESLQGLKGDPRWAVLVGLVLLLSLCVVPGGTPGDRTVPIVRGAASSEGITNLYLLLAERFPGLEVVRGPGALTCGVHLALCLLAGIGAAALLRAVPARWIASVTALLLVLTAIDGLRPRFLGLEPSFEWEMVEVRPSQDALQLFGELERLGNEGPLLEVPVNHLNMLKSSKGVLLTAYHHRPTSYCYNSFLPEQSRWVERLAADLPSVAALAELRALGFSTLIVHHAEGEVAAGARRKAFERFAAGPGVAALRPLAANESMSAYGILP